MIKLIIQCYKEEFIKKRNDAFRRLEQLVNQELSDTAEKLHLMKLALDPHLNTLDCFIEVVNQERKKLFWLIISHQSPRVEVLLIAYGTDVILTRLQKVKSCTFLVRRSMKRFLMIPLSFGLRINASSSCLVLQIDLPKFQDTLELLY